MNEPREPEGLPREVVPTTDDFVHQANLISRASYRLNPMLRRLIFLVIARVQADNAEEMYVSMQVGDVIRALGLESDGGNVYKRIRDSVEDAMSQVIKIEESNGKWTLYNWLDYASYNPNTDTLKIALHRYLQPYVLQVQKQFTQLRIAEFAKLQGRHSQRLYELLMSESGHAGRNGNRPGEWFLELEIPRLRKLLAIQENEYRKTNDLRKRVIDPPAEEIDKNPELPISVKVEYLRKGKRLRAVRYNCKWLRREDPRPVDPATMSEEQEREMIAENPELYEECLEQAKKQLTLPGLSGDNLAHRYAVGEMINRLKAKKGRKK